MAKNNNIKAESGILLAFGELFLKSKGVRRLLLNVLVNNINFALSAAGLDYSLYRMHSRIFIKVKKLAKARGVLKKVFGISWAAEAFLLETDLRGTVEFVAKNYPRWIKAGESFSLEVKRDSTASYSREQIIDAIAKEIKRKVDLSSPKVKIFIEARENKWLLYTKKFKGAGGLPTGAQGKVMTLVSGGIDSPVASWLLAKRGVRPVWVHFHSFPLVSSKSIEKVKELAVTAAKYQGKVKIYFVPLADIQIKIKTETPPKYRILLYRRIMLRIAQQLAQEEGCFALATGESLGQVGSQTLANLSILQEGVKLLILRPLIGLDKQEIISLAKKIKTFDISVKPQEDCCTLFVPKHPTAAGKLEQVKLFEQKLKISSLIKKALKETKIEIFG